MAVATGVNPLDGKLVTLSTVQQCILYRILVDIIFWTASGLFLFNLLSKDEKNTHSLSTALCAKLFLIVTDIFKPGEFRNDL